MRQVRLTAPNGPRRGAPALAVAGLLVLLPASPAGPAGEMSALQATILKVKPAVVQILVGVTPTVQTPCAPGGEPRSITLDPDYESGSGFIVNADGYIVTNAHVVRGYYEPLSPEDSDNYLRAALQRLCAPAGPTRGRDAEARLDQLVARLAGVAAVTVKKEMTVRLSSGKGFPGEVKQYSPPMSSDPSAVATSRGAGVERSGKDLAVLKIEGTNLPTVPVGDSDRVQVGEPVNIISIPVAVLDHRLLSRETAGDASVTGGRVSGRKQDARGVPIIQTDAAVSWGSSGSPAINAQGEVIGVTTFITVGGPGERQAIQGFNFLVPSNTAKEFLRAAQVDLTKRGPFTQHWGEGLEAYQAGDFETALRAIEGANRLFPDNRDVKRLLVEAQLRYDALPWWRRSVAVKGAGGGLVAILVAGGAYVGVSRLRRRRGPQGLERVGVDRVRDLLTRGDVLVVDARAEAAYAASPFRLPGAIRVPPGEADRRALMLSRMAFGPEKQIVTYCDSARETQSARVAAALRQRNFKRVFILAGGFEAWQQAGGEAGSKPGH
jgi:S1-C subfamily serine protease/rhodanese-related sulfurtransferase